MENIMSNGFAELSVNVMEEINGGGFLNDLKIVVGGSFIACSPLVGIAAGIAATTLIPGVGAVIVGAAFVNATAGSVAIGCTIIG